MLSSLYHNHCQQIFNHLKHKTLNCRIFFAW